MRGELRKQQVPFKDITVEQGRAVNVVLRDESQRAKAIEAIRNVDPSLAVSGQGDTIRLAYSDQDLFRRKKEVIDQSIEILRRRVDETGTIEPTIVRQGDERILLQVPGIKDTTDLKRKINQTAKLTFHLVNEDVARGGAGRQRAAHHLHGADARGHAGTAAQQSQGVGGDPGRQPAHERPSRSAGATSRSACRC